MAKIRFTSSDGAAHKGLIWAGWLLATCGFGILLGGVASMQEACGGSPINLITVGGTVGYLAPVSCDKLFRYTWWITFLHFFTWACILIALAMGVVHKWRAALVGLLAVTSVLLMDTANTYLYYNGINSITGTMKARTRATTAGAIIAAVADMFLLLLIGWHDEDRVKREESREYVAATTTAPAGTTAATTTTTTVPMTTAV